MVDQGHRRFHRWRHFVNGVEAQVIPKPRPRALEKAEQKQAADKHKREIYRRVDRRDGYKCRAYGIAVHPDAPDMLKRAHRHHIRFRSAGGQDTTANIVLLSAKAHAEVHAHILSVTGNADSTLTFEKTNEDGSKEVWFG
jgi:hypothetical protein